MGFEIFGLQIKWYGVLIASGMLVALALGIFLCKKRKYNSDVPYQVFWTIMPLAILGLRFYYIIFSDELTLLDFFDFSNGGLAGLALYGGVIGGALGVFIFSRIKKCSFLTITDLIVPGLILAQSIGRWGNFLNQEAYGYPVESEAFQFFPVAVFINNGIDDGWHLATFFYESFFNFMGFWLLLYIFFHQKKYGTVTAAYFIWYGIVRAIIEPFRTDSLVIFSGSDFVLNRISFLVSIAIILVGVVILYLNKKGKLSQNDERLH